MKTNKFHAKQLNNVKIGQIMLVINQTKPKKCELCGNKSQWHVLVKNGVNCIGHVGYCVECNEYTMKLNEKAIDEMEHDVWEQIMSKCDVLTQNAMVEA